ncbi:uncharacterized protein B0I36DRAFT_94826 [Microdochium trichocladiopsis]|uniref:Zn(2)-C6 fungal-type domain-containing protein n=1 Tax=Microdochium trichocladiopsis TaxID=1682393 RepID=A0A9P8YCY3_9PEZI|nr:uncharacterized protein B0I36DRAFT_94826 [Microdochium trichocladiopsis]KAH7035630.1 hypothetical protein B0I36DRAFT_94826 [Microdochium trichocladiopsis]
MEALVPESSAATAPRKKFAAPPVKSACLACRSSRTRCNGDKPCSSCKTRNRECEYLPSRRGGPRIRKKSKEVSARQDPPVGKTEEMPFSAIYLENYIEPGAGLAQLGDKYKSSDAIFEELFQQPVIADTTVCMARTYGLDQAAILNAYYIWIHPFFPILPRPQASPYPEVITPLFSYQNNDFEFVEPPSPISLALSAILALIPCPQDTTPMSPDSIRFRRNYSQLLAKSALESIEIASDRPESELEPARALDDADQGSARIQFHPEVPYELETIIALDLLSVYEYAQRGNLKKMSLRANAALTQALELGLHTDPTQQDIYTDAKRRTWWMTYVCISQVSIVSNTAPTWENLVSNITTHYPLIRSDGEAFGHFIQAQQAILAATKFVMELNKAREAGQGYQRIFERMLELERRLEPMCTRSESWILDCPLTRPVDGDEHVLAQALKCIARIKLNSARIKVHRYCAFFDTAIFSGKHCDLKSTRDEATPSPEQQYLQPCCTSSFESIPRRQMTHSNGLSSPPQSNRSTPAASIVLEAQGPLRLPFTMYHSSDVCLRSALNIAKAFDLMPYPNPTGQISAAPIYLGPNSPMVTPRTMPAFACCAMQSCYALLMVKSKAQQLVAGQGTTTETDSGSGPWQDNLASVQAGLFSVLMTLENYASAFEALGGMRDQVRDKVGFMATF